MAVDNKEEDKNRVDQYLKAKLKPLLESGSAWTVNWDKEPLPSEVNFILKTGWVPASELKKTSMTPGIHRGRYNRRRTPSPPPQLSPPQPKRINSPFNLASLLPQESMDKRKQPRLSSPPFTTISMSIPMTQTKNKKKAEKAEKALKKAKAAKLQQQQQKKTPKRWEMDGEATSGWRREERARRFAPVSSVSRQRTRSLLAPAGNTVVFYDFAHLNIVGTCQDVEKPFFRLTTVSLLLMLFFLCLVEIGSSSSILSVTVTIEG